MYLPAPTGGQAEYGADSDYLDDSWVPRIWNPMFGFFSFITNMPPFMADEAPWEVDFVDGHTPVKRPPPTVPDHSGHPVKTTNGDGQIRNEDSDGQSRPSTGEPKHVGS
jgi:hypothetical protein